MLGGILLAFGWTCDFGTNETEDFDENKTVSSIFDFLSRQLRKTKQS